MKKKTDSLILLFTFLLMANTMIANNDPPEAIPDFATTTINTPIVIPFLANDLDEDDLEELCHAVVWSPPHNGTFEITDNCQLLYTPNPGFIGQDCLFYEVCDSQFACDGNGMVCIQVNQCEPPELERPIQLCVGEAGLFDATFIQGAIYEWDFGIDGNPCCASSSGIHEVFYLTPGPKTINFHYNLNNCIHNFTFIVEVVGGSVADAGPDRIICAGQSALLSANDGAAYLWSTGETTQEIEVSPIETTTYSVTVTDDEGCTSSDEVQVNVSILSVHPIVGDLGCQDDPISLSANYTGGVPAVSWLWEGPGDFSSTLENPIVTFPNLPGAGDHTYSVTLTDGEGCTATGSVNVVLSPPEVSPEAEIPVCDETSFELFSNSFGGFPPYTYKWAGPNDFESNDENPLVFGDDLPDPGFHPYHVTIVDSHGCEGEGVFEVQIIEAPIIIISNDIIVCEDEFEEIGLTVDGGDGATYLWSTGETTSTIFVKPTETTAYAVRVTSAAGCTKTETSVVFVHPRPGEPGASYTGPLCEGDPLKLIANPPDAKEYTFSWLKDGAFFSNEQNPQILNADKDDTGTYTLIITDENGCTNSKTIEVLVKDCKTGRAFGPESENYKFDTLCDSCISPRCDEDEEEDDSMIPVPLNDTSPGKMTLPQSIEELNKPEKKVRPNSQGLAPSESEFNVYTGNVLIEIPVFSIPSVGPDLDFELVYNSGKTDLNFGFGNGWTFNYNLLWEKSGDDIIIRRGDGRRDLFEFDGSGYLAPPGISDRLIQTDPNQFLLKNKQGWEYYFEAESHQRLTKVVDRNGNELRLSYGGDLPMSIEDASGRVLQLDYTNDLLTSITDENDIFSRTVSFEYDAHGNMVEYDDQMGFTRTYTYDIHRNIIQTKDKNGNRTQLEYNASHAVTGMRSGLAQMLIEYDINENKTIVYEPVGSSIQQTTYTFDSEGRVTQIQGNCCGFDVAYQYDSSNNITQITDARGFEYHYTYDQKGNVLTETDPLGSTQQFQYDPVSNQPSFWKDKNGNTASGEYDFKGNLLKINLPNGIENSFTYLPNGLQESSTNGEGNTTYFEYDSFGNASKIKLPIGAYALEYNALGKLLSSTDPNGNTTLFEYDPLLRLSRITDPLGYSRETRYDPNNNPIWQKDKRDFVTRRIYDGHNRLIRIEEPLEVVTTFSYDERGNRVSEKDPNGNESFYTYDSKNRMLSETNAKGDTRYWEYDGIGNLIIETDYRGFQTIYEYDALNRKISEWTALNESTIMAYDANGNNTAITSPDGVQSSFEYDQLDRLISTQHSFSNVQYQFDKNHNFIQEADANGNSTHYEYDQNDRLLRITDAMGQETHFEYDLNGNRTSIRDKNGNETSTNYDELNRIIEVIDPFGNSKTFSYDEYGNRTSMTNERGFTTNFVYDDRNRITSIEHPIGTEFFEYDNNNNRISETDAEGRKTESEYDVLNRMIQTTFADNTTVSKIYDKNGNTLSISNEANETSHFTYDALDRIQSRTNPENETTSYSYDVMGNQISVVQPGGNVIRHVYDGESRLVAIYDLLGTVKTLTYDDFGNVIQEADGNGHTTSITYDVLHRPVSMTDAIGNAATMQYDSNDNLIENTDREGNSTLQTFDELNRKISKTNALGQSTHFEFDEVGNMTKIRDAKGNETIYAYDADDRLIQERFADGPTKEYGYDAVGNLISRKDQNGAVTNYQYDDRDRLILRDYPGPDGDQFVYDDVGRLTFTANTQAMVQFGYDKNGRMLFESLDGHTSGFQYDIPNRKRRVLYSGGNHILEESRDVRGRLQSVSRNGNTVASWYYDAGNRLQSKSYANGTSSHFTYNNNDWLTSLMHENVEERFAHFHYDFDKVGNKLTEEKRHQPDASEKYTYDARYRLTKFEKGAISSGNIQDQIDYQYDALSNREMVNANGNITNYASNPVNEYTSISGSPNPVYDSNGNLTSDGVFTYQYDFENRLVSVNNGSVASYEYDPLGRRVRKITPQKTTNYFYDNSRVIEEKDELGNREASYIYGYWVDDLLLMNRNNQDYFYHKNSLGSVSFLTNAFGNPVEQYEYDPYGNVSILDTAGVVLNDSAFDNPYLYTGRRLDQETGLYYYRARYYNAQHGRFLQRDPLGYVDGYNLYEYVRSNPLNRWDPFGEDDEEIDLLKQNSLEPGKPGFLKHEKAEELRKWLNKTPLIPGNENKRVVLNFFSCETSEQIFNAMNPQKPYMDDVLKKSGFWDVETPLKRLSRLQSAIAQANNLSGFFGLKDYGLHPDGKYCGTIEITRHWKTDATEKSASQEFSLKFKIQLNSCNGLNNIDHTVKLTLLRWDEEHSDEEPHFGEFRPGPRKKKKGGGMGKPVITPGGGSHHHKK